MVWQSFESLAREQGLSIDQLIGEAMEAYAAQRGYNIPEEPAEDSQWSAPSPHMQDIDEARDPLEETHDAPSMDDLDRSYSPRGGPPPQPTPRRQPSYDSNNSSPWDDDNDLARTETRDAIRRPLQREVAPEDARTETRHSFTKQSPQPMGPLDDIREPGEESRTTPRHLRGIQQPISSQPAPTGNFRPPTMPIPAAVQRPVPTPAAGSMVSRSTRPLQPPMPPPGTNRAVAPPPQARPQDPPPLRDTGSNPALGQKRLFLFHQGRQVEVDKERFVLGRSKTQADLRLDDPNVSRQHAAIEKVGPAWYIVDLGSTNGVYVAGQRVARRAIADGDVLTITSHEVRCSLR
jgi:hypothetical protein